MSGQNRDSFGIFSTIDFVPQHKWTFAAKQGENPDGWNYGNRLHYACVYWHLNRAGIPVARFTFQRVADYLKISDEYGVQTLVSESEACGPTGEYTTNDKPEDLPTTIVRVKSHGKHLGEMVFPATSEVNPDVWFELSEDPSDSFVQIEQYRVNTVVGLITAETFDPDVRLRIVQTNG